MTFAISGSMTDANPSLEKWTWCIEFMRTSCRSGVLSERSSRKSGVT